MLARLGALPHTQHDFLDELMRLNPVSPASPLPSSPRFHFLTPSPPLCLLPSIPFPALFPAFPPPSLNSISFPISRVSPSSPQFQYLCPFPLLPLLPSVPFPSPFPLLSLPAVPFCSPLQFPSPPSPLRSSASLWHCSAKRATSPSPRSACTTGAGGSRRWPRAVAGNATLAGHQAWQCVQGGSCSGTCAQHPPATADALICAAAATSAQYKHGSIENHISQH
eukprot:360908-Chlamydomonas_euryale.AAC.7